MQRSHRRNAAEAPQQPLKRVNRGLSCHAQLKEAHWQPGDRNCDKRPTNLVSHERKRRLNFGFDQYFSGFVSERKIETTAVAAAAIPARMKNTPLRSSP